MIFINPIAQFVLCNEIIIKMKNKNTNYRREQFTGLTSIVIVANAIVDRFSFLEAASSSVKQRVQSAYFSFRSLQSPIDFLWEILIWCGDLLLILPATFDWSAILNSLNCRLYCLFAEFVGNCFFCSARFPASSTHFSSFPSLVLPSINFSSFFGSPN